MRSFCRANNGVFSTIVNVSPAIIVTHQGRVADDTFVVPIIEQLDVLFLLTNCKYWKQRKEQITGPQTHLTK